MCVKKNITLELYVELESTHPYQQVWIFRVISLLDVGKHFIVKILIMGELHILYMIAGGTGSSCNYII